MAVDETSDASRNVERLFELPHAMPVSDTLRKLTAMIAPHCPKDCIIKFEYDGRLHLIIDIRRFEDMTALETLLPVMWDGTFYNVQRGIADKHSFFHRLTALVRR